MPSPAYPDVLAVQSNAAAYCSKKVHHSVVERIMDGLYLTAALYHIDYNVGVQIGLKAKRGMRSRRAVLGRYHFHVRQHAAGMCGTSWVTGVYLVGSSGEDTHPPCLCPPPPGLHHTVCNWAMASVSEFGTLLRRALLILSISRNHFHQYWDSHPPSLEQQHGLTPIPRAQYIPYHKRIHLPGQVQVVF